MKAVAYRNRIIFIPFSLIIFCSLFLVNSGCDDSGVAPPPPTVTDTNVVIYKSVAAFFWQNIFNDSNYSGINLLDGDSTRHDSVNKDMELLDSAGTFTNFYFISGNRSSVPGKKTRFNRISSSMTPYQFDTLSVIPISDSVLTPSNFTQDSTAYWAYFNISQTKYPVYSFYLQGRHTGNKYIYGVFHVKSIQRVYSSLGLTYGVLIIIDIKLNKAGLNHFVVKSPA